jgi:site-specific DNA recombinase
MARQRVSKKLKAAQLDLALGTACTALYVRVSTDKQADEGFSLADQQERLQAYCVAQGWNVCADHIYIDGGVSGKTTDRPQFKAMMQAAQAHKVQRIVAMKLDRMARNVREFLATVDTLKAYGCDLVLVKESFDTSTPHGRFALTMFAAMAELEASTITERVMSGKVQKASKGGYNGSCVAYGYSYTNSVFTIEPEQAAVVADIFKQYVSGKSMLGIANGLTAVGILSPNGKAWNHVTVRHMLSNGLYAGLMQYDGKTTQGDQPAIVSVDLYNAVQLRMDTTPAGNPNFAKAA